jgi:hypothetical protein
LDSRIGLKKAPAKLVKLFVFTNNLAFLEECEASHDQGVAKILPEYYSLYQYLRL